MSEVSLIFFYYGKRIQIHCKRNEYMKDIFQRYLKKIEKDRNDVYFLYNGDKINEDLKLKEINNKDKEIDILVNNIDNTVIEDEDELKLSKDIICPECREICLFNFDDYKIILNKCKNEHNIENILLDEFDNLQKINEAKIVCDQCNKNKKEIYNNRLFKCCSCNLNLCPICRSLKHKDHIIIDYELKDYLCNIHGDKYISYCKKCNKNLCDSCERDHKDHNYDSLNKLIIDKDNNINELRIKIDNLKNEIQSIITTLNKILDNFEKYYDINDNIFKNDNMKNKNYERIMNINKICKYNENIIKEINDILKEKKIENKIKYMYDIYNKMIAKNEIKIKYEIGKEDKIKIFGDMFVKKNKNNYQMIINDNNCELNSFYNLNNNNEENGILEIKLKQLKNVNNISCMFEGCSSLSQITNISKWNLFYVTDLENMFSQCNKLSSLPDISNWNTNKVKNMAGMFQSCSSLSQIPDISKWNTNSVTNMEYMFNECNKLSSLPDISNWNTKKVKNISGMFQKCSSLTKLPDISNWNTKNVHH